MFELPEIMNISKQINETLTGKKIVKGSLGNSPHKFVWYNRTHEEFAKLVEGKTLESSYVLGSWLMIPFDPGYTMVFGEFGGKLLYHSPMDKLPDKYHLLIQFSDDSSLSETIQLWGAIELYEKGKELERPYIKDMKISPVDSGFNLSYFSSLVGQRIRDGKKSVKSLLAQDQSIPGLGNSTIQDILFKAGLHPKHPLKNLTEEAIEKLYNSILDTVQQIFIEGGRSEEVDLFGRPGGYERIMSSKNAAGKPCPACGSLIKKISYLGGSCYFCPECQI